MKALSLKIVLIFVVLALPRLLHAQEAKPDPINDVSRYKVYFWKFAPGGKDIAKEYVWDHMLPAMRAAGIVEPIILHPDDGEWDMVSIYLLPGGYNDLHYNMSPSDARWQSIARQGKKGDGFKALAAKLDELIVRESTFIAHRHNDSEE